MSAIRGDRSISITDLSLGDLDEAVVALSHGEGYSGTSAPQLLAPRRLRARLLPFVGSPDHGAWKATIANGSGMTAFLFFLHRNRLTETFDAGNVVARLPPSAFPPNGEFIEVFELWVAPAFRRLGIAAAMKVGLEQYALDQGISMLFTVTEAHHEAVLELNRKLGYVPLYSGLMWDEVPRTALAKYLDPTHLRSRSGNDVGEPTTDR